MKNIFYKTVIDTDLARLYCLYTLDDTIVFLGSQKDKLESILAALGNITGPISVRERENLLAEKEIKRYLDRKTKSIKLKPLILIGSDFAKKVWSNTRKIKYGSTSTYGDIANLSGSPRAYRAVGSALSKNPVFLIVPCHRVIKSDGDIGGFASGRKMKARLLRLESIIP